MGLSKITNKYVHPEIDKLRLILLAFSLLYTYGVYTPINEYTSVFFGFAPPAFFIISGYLVLREDDEKNVGARILRAIRRTAICFVILTVVYTLASLIAAKTDTMNILFSKQFWVDFVLLNTFGLPVGYVIWYVQAMLYAYIIIYILYKLKLLKYDIPIALLCIAAAVLTGELSSFVDFKFFGHTYFSGNFLNRALPYILIGRYVHRKKKSFIKLKISDYFVIASVGLAASFAEYFLLSYFERLNYAGHMLGMVITAAAVCFFGFFISGNVLTSATFDQISRFERMIPYFVSPVIYYLLALFFIAKHDHPIFVLSDFIGLLTAIFSFLFLGIYSYIRRAAEFYIGLLKFNHQEKLKIKNEADENKSENT